MSAAKRPASNSFGNSQMVVKRQKSNTDINGKDLAVTGGGKSANGALIQAVSQMPSPSRSLNRRMCAKAILIKEGQLMENILIGTTHQWSTSTHYGTRW